MRNRYELRGSLTAVFVRRRSGEVIEILIDTEDLSLVQQYTWGVIRDQDTGSFYPVARIYVDGRENCISLRLSRFLLGLVPPGLVVDHINHNTLDNRRANLRPVPESVNQFNRKGAQKNSRTGIRGVSWCQATKRWIGVVQFKRKYHSIGHFLDIEAARHAVEKFRESIGG